MRKKATATGKSARAKQVTKKRVKQVTKKSTKATGSKPRGARREPARQKTWVITTSPTRPIDEVARDLAKAGLTRRKVLRDIGSIVGSAGAHAAARLRGIRGVATVEPETPIDIGPPGSPSTW